MTVERRRLPLRGLWAAALGASVLAGSTQAGASWSTGGAGDAATGAGTVPAASAPTVQLVGGDVVVDWSAVAAPTPGYVVRRYDGGGVEQPVGAGCDVTTVFLTCTEASVPSGTWRYTVTAEVGSWQGGESPPSDPVVVP